jgi:protein SCO1
VRAAAATRRAVLLAALVTSPALAADQDPWPVAFGGPFRLTDHTGRPRTDADFRGSWLLVQFGYTACPDLCPLGLDTLAGALDGLGPDLAARVQPLFVTVDPARDTVAALAAFAPATFHPRLLALTGTEAEVAAVAKAYRVHRRKVVPDPADAADYLVDHGTFTYLMRPDGTFATLIPAGADAAERMATVVRGHLTR